MDDAAAAAVGNEKPLLVRELEVGRLQQRRRRGLGNKLLSLLRSFVAILRATGPLCPATQFAIFLACLHIASLCLRGLTTRLAVVHHRPLYISYALSDTAATLGRALAPTAPLMQLAIDRAWVIVAARHGCKWQALCTTLWLRQHIARELLLTTGTFLGAFLRIPFGNFAILEES